MTSDPESSDPSASTPDSQSSKPGDGTEDFRPGPSAEDERERIEEALDEAFEGPFASRAGASDAGGEGPSEATPGGQGARGPFAGPAAGSDGAGKTDSLAGMGGGMALEMARLWIREHQKASMLGAFAVGVFAGALLRD